MTIRLKTLTMLGLAALAASLLGTPQPAAAGLTHPAAFTRTTAIADHDDGNNRDRDNRRDDARHRQEEFRREQTIRREEEFRREQELRRAEERRREEFRRHDDRRDFQNGDRHDARDSRDNR